MINFVSLHKIVKYRGRRQSWLSLPAWIYDHFGIVKGEHNHLLLESDSKAPGAVRLRLPSKRELRLADEGGDALMLYLNGLWSEDEESAKELDETAAELRELHANNPPVLDDCGILVPAPLNQLTRGEREMLKSIKPDEVVTYNDIIKRGKSRGWVLRFLHKCEEYDILIAQEPTKQRRGRPVKRWKRAEEEKGTK